MAEEKKYQSDVVVVGGGIAGIVTALELLNLGKKVLLLDRDKEENMGGLARWAFGGMFFVDTPEQRLIGIKDSVDLALRDWFSVAEFEEGDVLPKKWAESYVNNCTDYVYRWLKKHGIGYFPIVHWVERGHMRPGNSYPRFHMVWGTGWGLSNTMKGHLYKHSKKDSNLQLKFGHKVEDILTENGQAIGVRGIDETTGEAFEAKGEAIVIATGGMGGNIERVKRDWYKPWGEAPEVLLNGSHEFALGDLHDAVETINGNVTHLDKTWPYAAGVHHPKPRHKDHGLSLVPCKSALWLDTTGKRFGPEPLITAYDTKFTVEQICKQENKYSWQVLNMKIANKEFGISGSESNEAIRDKKIFGFLKAALYGNRKLVKDMLENCVDFVTANTVEELVDKMNALNGDDAVKFEHVNTAITEYDDNIARGPKFHNDDQLRRIAHTRQYRGDRVRTCKFQKIVDKNAMPLIAIREFILSRKTLGGIQTDMDCRVLTKPGFTGEQEPIPGLFAVGEASGFGGGGSHGSGALEGTFLGACVYTGRIAAYNIAGKKLI